MRGRVQRDPFPGFSWVGVKQRVSISRKVLLLVISLALLAGAWCSLIYLGVLSAPAFFKDIPVVNRLVDTSDVTTSKSSPVEQEKRQLLERIKSLQGKMTKLEQQVRVKETELQQAKSTLARVNKQVEELKNANLTSQGQDEVFKELAGYYSSIKPKDSAKVFEQLDDETVIGILQHMDSEQVGKILAAMSPERAALITKKMLAVETPGTT